MIKEDIYVENYVMTNMPFHHRQKLAMLRTGCLPIQIEMGRRLNIPLNQRICQFCHMNSVEDEIHLLLECPLYDDIRFTVTRYVQDNTTSLKDQYICLLSNPNIQAELGKCIFSIMKRRALFQM